MGKRSGEARPTVLFLHGLGNDLFFPNIGFYKHMLRAGFNVITSDLDGHGREGTSTFCEQNLTSLVDDIIRHVRWIAQSERDIHLCGFSLGGVLALDYAARQSTRIKSVSTIGMPLILQGDIGMICETFTPWLKSFRSALPDYGPLGIQPALGPILRRRYPVRLREAESANYLQIAGRLIRRIDPKYQLTAVKIPINYLAGSLDFIGYQRGTANFLDALEGKPGFTRQIIPRENHFSIMLSPKTPSIIADLLRKAS
jgi:pimeloyl-ACP methyl ester carboxylesterase